MTENVIKTKKKLVAGRSSDRPKLYQELLNFKLFLTFSFFLMWVNVRVRLSYNLAIDQKVKCEFV